MNNQATGAKQSLKHYLRLAVEANGMQWRAENDNEVDAIVDLIVEAAAHEGAKRALRALPPSVQE
jgi:hypothetical protein